MRGGGLRRRSIAAALAAFLVAAAPAPSPPSPWTSPETGSDVLPATDSGGVRHVASGYRFPPRLGAIPLRRKWAIGPRDVMVEYTVNGGGGSEPWLDVIVFDYGRPLAAEAEDADRAIEASWKPLDGAAAMLTTPASATAARARWSHRLLKGTPVTTGYVMVKRGDWVIEARASIPDASGAAGVAQVQSALDAMDWTGGAPS